MLFGIGQMTTSAGYALGIAVAMIFFYAIIRPMHLRYYRDKRQILRRRLWYREERARRNAAGDLAAIRRLGTWRNPELVVSKIEKRARGLKLEFENDPPAFFRDLNRIAVVRPAATNSDATVAKILLPSLPSSYPVLRVLLPQAYPSFVQVGDTFKFADDFGSKTSVG